MVFYDVADHGEAQPCTLLLGGEKGIEHLFQVLFRNAPSCIGKNNLHVFAFGLILCRNPDLVPLTCGLQRVQDHVDENLLQLLRAATDRREVVRQRDLETVGVLLDLLAQDAEHRIECRPDVDLGRHLEIGLEHLYSTLDVDGGRLFTAQVPQMTAVWQFNPRTFVRAILQYYQIERDQDLYEDAIDELERDFFVQLLFSYKVNPRTVFFAGYSEGGYENQDFSMTSTGRAVFLKIGYSWLW